MSTIILAWELGGGLGHLVQLRPIAHALLQRGHRIVVVLRDLSRARRVFGDAVILLQAPVKTRPPDTPISPPFTFSHILHNLGYEHEDELIALASAWRNLFTTYKPDLAIFDHAPTALLASRGLPTRQMTIGSGFCIPPDQHPLPNLRPWKPADPQALIDHEQQTLERINRALAEFRQPPLDRITQLYSRVNETLLVTFKELDHYAGRDGATYWGAWTDAGGERAEWPAGEGKRIFAYLKPCPAVPALLRHLARRAYPTLVVLDGAAEKLSHFACPTLRIHARPLDITQAARECDLAILNAGHGATAAMLLAGKPILQLPIWLEQGLLARAMVRNIGAGLQASAKNPRQAVAALEQMLESDRFPHGAQRFAATYREFSPHTQTERIVARVEALLKEA